MFSDYPTHNSKAYFHHHTISIHILKYWCNRAFVYWLRCLWMFFVDFTHVPPSRYLFQGADLEKCTAGDTLDSSSGSSDNASLKYNSEDKGSSPCINRDRQPDAKSSNSPAVEELPSQEQSNDIKSPSSSQTTSTVETSNTDRISLNHNETTVDDIHEPCCKKPKLD